MKIFTKRNFILFAILGLFIQPAFAKDIKIIQITDSHLSLTDDFSTRDTASSVKALKASIEDINKIPDVDFVIFTGDNIDQSNLSDLKAFLQIANKLKAPYYVVIGNHEVFKSQKCTKKDYMKMVSKYSKNCRTKNANYEFTKKGVVFLVVDGAKEIIPGPAGYYKKDTLKWLDKKLTQHKDEQVVIFQHFPIEPPYYNRTHATYNVNEYKDVIKNHTNIIAIISGHFHANGEKMVDGIYHISTPAHVESPHSYKIIEIETGKKPIIYTQLRQAEPATSK